MERLERALDQALLFVGGVILLSALGLAIVHLGTLHGVNQTSGAWLAFAAYARDGVLYPPLFADGCYAGTRYMPLFFGLHGALSWLTGDLLSAGKLLTLLSTTAIISALFTVLRRRVERAGLALALAALLLATGIGHRALLTIRSDVLPLALGLCALALFERRRSGPGLWASAALAGLAPLAKFTSLHPLTAGFLSLAPRARLRALLYGAAGFLVVALGLALTQLLSEGRFFANLSSAALGPQANQRGVGQALWIYAYYLRQDRALLPILLLAALSFLRRPSLSEPFPIYFLLQLVISLGFFLDMGAEDNHLVDLAAAALVLAAGTLTQGPPALRLGARGLLLAAGIYGLLVHHRPGWSAEERARTPERVFARALDLAGRRFLSQDPTVAVLLGQRPVVADDFQYRALAAQGLVPQDELPARLGRGEFERVVLLTGPEPDPGDPGFLHRELGPEVARAVRERYRFEKQVGRHYLYVPR